MTRAIPDRPAAEKVAQAVGYSTVSSFAMRKVTVMKGSRPSPRNSDEGTIENVAPVSTSASTVRATCVDGLPISRGTRNVPTGDVLPVVGAVGSGGAVQVCSGLLERVEVAVVVVTGALEHHVFEEVGKAGSAYFLILGADMVPDVDRHQRNRVVLVEYDIEAVGEGELFKRYGDHFRFLQVS